MAITMPNNSAFGVVTGVAAGLLGFALIWHMWWLVIVTFVAIVVLVVRRTLNDNSEHEISADTLYRDDMAARKDAV